jgi:hypothetical protein
VHLEFLRSEIGDENVLQILEELAPIEDHVQGNEILLQKQIEVGLKERVPDRFLDLYCVDFPLLGIHDRVQVLNQILWNIKLCEPVSTPKSLSMSN